ncbi:proteinase inhibitor i78 [Asticcacaulis sp. AC466]|uniref:proteinase inhibitor i78 n=1 Tax=Asticcacaulis sp. AC466 TaxID=1282362 RepID=UPI0012DD6910|nr:proteinase inhibitor i78 [Asticcacaulis sp. AC466]
MKQILTAGAIVTFACVGLASCSSTPEPQPQTEVRPPRPQTQTPVHRPPSTPVPSSSYKPMADDQCGATALQYLVGKPRTEIPVPLNPGSRRVVCSTCIVTQEYRADRQTIVFSSETGIIQSVKCG